MEDVRKSVEKMFGNDEVISLDVLDNVQEDYVSLSILDRPPRNEKCRHLSPLMNCNVGGSGHAGCADENFHSHCGLKALANRRTKR